MKKKPKKGARPDAKPQTKLEPVDSFFNFFAPPQIPQDETELDGQELEALHDAIEADFDTGDTLRGKIVPHAVDWCVALYWFLPTVHSACMPTSAPPTDGCMCCHYHASALLVPHPSHAHLSPYPPPSQVHRGGPG